MKHKSIVIIEDEMIISLSIKKWLEAIGFKIIGIMARGEDAIEFVKNHKPDLLIVDIVLQGELDGISTIEQIDRINSEFKIPVIYITAFSEKYFLERAEKTNPFGYLVKPIDIVDMCHLACSAVENSNTIH